MPKTIYLFYFSICIGNKCQKLPCSFRQNTVDIASTKDSKNPRKQLRAFRTIIEPTGKAKVDQVENLLPQRRD